MGLWFRLTFGAHEPWISRAATDGLVFTARRTASFDDVIAKLSHGVLAFVNRSSRSRAARNELYR